MNKEYSDIAAITANIWYMYLTCDKKKSNQHQVKNDIDETQKYIQ